nr:MAG TPA: hypothetical protein [Caudoviricetes sp.]
MLLSASYLNIARHVRAFFFALMDLQVNNVQYTQWTSIFSPLTAKWRPFARLTEKL